jgi:hypothetical protein
VPGRIVVSSVWIWMRSPGAGVLAAWLLAGQAAGCADLRDQPVGAVASGGGDAAPDGARAPGGATPDGASGGPVVPVDAVTVGSEVGSGPTPDAAATSPAPDGPGSLVSPSDAPAPMTPPPDGPSPTPQPPDGPRPMPPPPDAPPDIARDTRPPCPAGEACPVPDGCKVGRIECGSGAPVCVPRDKPDGTPCLPDSCGGRDLMMYRCQGGSCAGMGSRCEGRCRADGTGCEDCGRAGEPCCEPPTASCRSANLVCASGRCRACGALGQDCCASGCNAGFPCQDNRCVCGGEGQPCCPGDSCQLGSQICLTNRMPGRDPGDPPIDAALEGRCWACGFVLGNPCCANEACFTDQLFCGGVREDGVRRCSR